MGALSFLFFNFERSIFSFESFNNYRWRSKNDLFTNVEVSRLVILVSKKIEGEETREKKKKKTKNKRFLYASVNMTVNCVEKKKREKKRNEKEKIHFTIYFILKLLDIILNKL